MGGLCTASRCPQAAERQYWLARADCRSHEIIPKYSARGIFDETYFSSRLDVSGFDPFLRIAGGGRTFCLGIEPGGAQQTAAQTNRLVLVHFWAPWCGPCKWMETEVFSQADVARQIQVNYVPVKLDYDQNAELAKKFGVSGLPTDVILTPQGQIVNVAQGKADAAQYIARLNQWSATVRQQNAAVLAAIPAGNPAGMPNSPAVTPQFPTTSSFPPLANPVAPQPVAPRRRMGNRSI